MKKYYTELVNEGYNELHPAMVEFIVKEMKKRYGRKWWDEILDALRGQMYLPAYGEEQELIQCLDRANCCRVLTYKHRDLFYNQRTGNDCKVWATELMGVRNELAHDSVQDLSQKDAERYLDTMVRLAAVIAPHKAETIRALYREVRATAPDIAKPVPEGYYPTADQKSTSDAGTLDLLSIDDASIVEPTGLSRKLTINGETLAYPVYRVRLDKLFYNDRNDRILTWISQYKDENGVDDLSALSREDYNRIIEDFIVKSNPAAIEKTRNNIALVNQREPGVTLSDGFRIFFSFRYTWPAMMAACAFSRLGKSPRDTRAVSTLSLSLMRGPPSAARHVPRRFPRRAPRPSSAGCGCRAAGTDPERRSRFPGPGSPLPRTVPAETRRSLRRSYAPPV